MPDYGPRGGNVARKNHVTPSPAAGTPTQRDPSWAAAFRYAGSGWWYVVRTQRNAWIHAGISTGVLILGAWLGLGRIEWAILILTFGVVWVAEFTNTALEALVDLASPELHPLAKVAKDVAAGAVLVAAGTAVLVGLLILGPPLLAKVVAR